MINTKYFECINCKRKEDEHHVTITLIGIYCNECMPLEKTVSDEKINMEETAVCQWCDSETPESELKRTELGMLCDQCIRAIESKEGPIAKY